MLIKNLAVRGLLSFGPQGVELPLRPLNVLIGANGSGKSNFLEILSLLRASTRSLPTPIKEMGGVRGWFWKGHDAEDHARIEVLVDNPKGQQPTLRHRIELTRHDDRFEVFDEKIENEMPYPGKDEPYFFYSFRRGRPMLKGPKEAEESLPVDNIIREESILSQVKDPGLRYPAISQVQKIYESIKLFRNWQFGPSARLRREINTAERNDFLSEGGENLALVISKIKPKIKRELIENLRCLYAGIEDVDIVIDNGSAQLFLDESGGRQIPATRLSDGTLRYLCLLAILLHPEDGGVIVIEEPELGLHPDVIPKIADLIQQASTRMQLVVTTHSRVLIDALGDDPDSVVVCEKRDGESRFERLERTRLEKWLDRYSLGDLWTSGELGGNRW
ncbi:MAG TPA: AAA family ATPase [Fimbriimonadaceae bacterium]|nr:AAA family ATPase [Fimbriimonadaceae bacterium]